MKKYLKFEILLVLLGLIFVAYLATKYSNDKPVNEESIGVVESIGFENDEVNNFSLKDKQARTTTPLDDVLSDIKTLNNVYDFSSGYHFEYKDYLNLYKYICNKYQCFIIVPNTDNGTEYYFDYDMYTYLRESDELIRVEYEFSETDGLGEMMPSMTYNGGGVIYISYDGDEYISVLFTTDEPAKILTIKHISNYLESLPGSVPIFKYIDEKGEYEVSINTTNDCRSVGLGGTYEITSISITGTQSGEYIFPTPYTVVCTRDGHTINMPGTIVTIEHESFRRLFNGEISFFVSVSEINPYVLLNKYRFEIGDNGLILKSYE